MILQLLFLVIGVRQLATVETGWGGMADQTIGIIFLCVFLNLQKNENIRRQDH